MFGRLGELATDLFKTNQVSGVSDAQTEVLIDKPKFGIDELIDERQDAFNKKSFEEFQIKYQTPDIWYHKIILEYLSIKFREYCELREAARYWLEHYTLEQAKVAENKIKIRLLQTRNTQLRKIMQEYKDCLDERVYALSDTQLTGSLTRAIEGGYKDFKPCEIFEDAIFFAYYAPLQKLLTLDQCEKMIITHGRCGVNGVAGAQLCRILCAEIKRRIYDDMIDVVDSPLNAIAIYFSEHWPNLLEELQEVICKKVLINIETGKWLATDERVFTVLAECKMLGLDTSYIAGYYEKIAKTLTAKIIDDIHRDVLSEFDPKIAIYKNWLAQHAPAQFSALSASLQQRLNLKAYAFRKIYEIIFSSVQQTNFYSPLFYAKKLAGLASACYQRSRPTLVNYLQDKENISAEVLLADVSTRFRDPNTQLEAFVWQLTQKYFRDVSADNKPLFKEIFKGAFAFSSGGVSRVAGTVFFHANEAFNAAVDQMNDADIDALEGEHSRKAEIYKQLSR